MLPRVRDHEDIISADYFKRLIRQYLLLLRVNAQEYPELNDLISKIQALPEPIPHQPVSPRYINVLAEACRKLCEVSNLAPPARLRTVRSLDWVRADDVNALVDCIEQLPQVTTVCLFNVNDWSTARNYVTDYCLIFSTYTNPNLPSSEVRALVASKEIVFAVQVDTEPYRRYNAVPWHGNLYTILNPPYCDADVTSVTDPFFQQYLGSSVPALFDYCVSLDYKVPGAKNWTGDTCGWGYKVYERGAIVEVPNDGIWESAAWLGRYVDALSAIFLGVLAPLRILYLAGYVSDIPLFHECFPIDECWRALAAARGWQLVDLR